MDPTGVPFLWGAAIPRREYDRPTERVAKELLGKILARRWGHGFRLGRITETEAYLGLSDPASHLAKGFTPRTEETWGHPGVAYVFLSYGLHSCFNVITLSKPPFGGVLVRGLEPLQLVEGYAVPNGHTTRDGPGRVTRYLGIGQLQNGESLQHGSVRILSTGFLPLRVAVTPRIGISKATDRPLRFAATRFRTP